jgi:hypothetical protein
MNGLLDDEERQKDCARPSGMTRPFFLKLTFVWAVLLSLKSSIWPASVKAVEGSVPVEPEDLDVPTPWQEGDPEPKEENVPSTEPEQTSNEAPPGQPMDDDRGDQPGPDHAWVCGYWWWTDGRYVWVPGYWAIPPNTEYVYISGYWTHVDGIWRYRRGGWGRPNTPVVIIHAGPRHVTRIYVISAPPRIVRRHRHWHYHHSRRYQHQSHRSSHPHLRPPGVMKTQTPGPASGPARAPQKRQRPHRR